MKVSVFFNILVKSRFSPFTGVPCAIIKDLIKYAESSKEPRYYTATSEGEAMGIAAGFSLSGRLPVVLLQNDGLGNAINPISSLQLFYNLPVLLIITWRGEPGGRPDAPQHKVMGQILPGLLDLLRIPYRILKDDEAAVKKDIRLAKKYLSKARRPYAFIVRRDYFELSTSHRVPHLRRKEGPKRIDYIQALVDIVNNDDLLLATTGFTGREMVQEIKRDGTFYMAGSMGCATSVSLAVALEHPKRQVYLLDGDGALLMKLGTLATIGLYQPKNLVHILFDNGLYESTGGQKTASEAVSFPGLALNSNYRYAKTITTVKEFITFLKAKRRCKGPIMCHIKFQPGTPDKLKRPSESGPELRDRFMAAYRHSAK